MKKLRYWIAGLFFVALITAAVVNANLAYDTNTHGDFIFNNVEALAQGEGGDGECGGNGNVDCGGSTTYEWKISR